MDSKKHVEIGLIPYLFTGGEKEKYLKKVCEDRLPFISYDEDHGEYFVDLNPLKTQFKDDAIKLLKKSFSLSVTSAFTLIISSPVKESVYIHERFLETLRNNDLFVDKNMQEKVKHNISNLELWQYWDMISNYAEARKNFRYYRETYNIAMSLYNKSSGTIIDVGIKDVTTTLDLFSSSFEKYALDNDYPANFEAPLDINIINTDLFKFSAAKFNIVLCQQVLEHLDAPSDAFKKLYSLSKDVLVISLPYGSWHRTKWDPIDENRVYDWTNKKPDIASIVEDFGVQRIILGYKVGENNE